jgi:hypothetical protein
MLKRRTEPRRQLFLTLFALAAFVTCAADAAAQAWTPPAGAGSVSLSYQRISNLGHVLTNGFFANGGFSTNMGAYVEGEYALTDRLAVSAGLPYVFSKYTDPNPPPPPIPYLPVEQCHCWKGGWQDFGATARYNVFKSENSAFSLTPSVGIGMPSHDYNFRGEAALGRDLREFRIALDVGQRLDPISSKLVVQGRYSYAFVERVLNISTNRSNISFEGDYQLTRKLVARGLFSIQRTHGGLRFGSPPPASLVFPGEVNTPELLFQHDRLLRDNNWRPGAGLTYSFRNIDVFASDIEYAGGTDTHAGRALTFGVSWPFEISRRSH